MSSSAHNYFPGGQWGGLIVGAHQFIDFIHFSGIAMVNFFNDVGFKGDCAAR